MVGAIEQRRTAVRTAAIVCNTVLFAITGVILVTEGVPRDARHLALSLLMVLVPLLSAVVLVLERTASRGPSRDEDGSSTRSPRNRAAVLGNLALFGASCWASVAQYPYPEGNSVIPFVLLAIGAPLLNLTALLREGRKAMKTSPHGAVGGERG
jgi:hypothetical protein